MRATVFLLLSTFTAGAAMAKDAPPAPSTSDVRQLFVGCLQEEQAKASSFFLAHSDMGSIDVAAYGGPDVELGRKLGVEQCLSSVGGKVRRQLTIKTGRAALRTMMVEATYRARFPTPPEWLKQPIAPAQRTFVSTGEKLAVAKQNGKIADCLFRADPVTADQLIRSSVDSQVAVERTAVLMPLLNKCAADNAGNGVNAETLRQFAAEGLWQAVIERDSVAQPAATDGHS